jgi:hypothetical protein
LCCNKEEAQKDAERHAAILASLEWQHIVDDLSELSEVEVDTRLPPGDPAAAENPRDPKDSVLQVDRQSTRIQRVDVSPASHRMFDRPQYPQVRAVESLRI